MFPEEIDMIVVIRNYCIVLGKYYMYNTKQHENDCIDFVDS